jgi:hypothetical protein
MSDLSKFFMILEICIVSFIFIRKFRARVHSDDFSYLTVREQLAVANQTAETISELEQLRGDMDECNPDDLVVVHIEWLGHDNELHGVDFSADGYNTVTSCFDQIAEREIEALKNELAHQCSILSKGGRRRQNDRQYQELLKGEGSIAETVSTLRSMYLDG